MRKKLLFFLLFVGNMMAFAQTATETHTANISCPSTGSVTVTTTVTNPSFMLYEASTNALVAGPQTTGTFNQLMVGSYYAKVVGDNGAAQTANFTIASSYKAMSAADVTVTTNCGSYTAGGTIKVNGVTGGSAPYTYVFVKSNTSNFDDSSMVYSSSNTYAASSYGTYQIRIKDNCGATYTVTKTLSPTLTPIANVYFAVANNVDCTGKNATLYNYSFYDANGGSVDYNSYVAAGGVLLELWEQTTSGCPSSAPASAPIFSQKLTKGSYPLPVVPSKKYIARITTPCGDQKLVCLDKTFDETRSLSAVALTNKTACNDAELMTIKPTENYFFKFPVDVSVKNSAGTVVYTKTGIGTANGDINTNSSALNSWSATNLPLGDYTITYTDACGVKTNYTVKNPAKAGPLQIEGADYYLWRCGDIPAITQTGTTQIGVYITGYMPNSANATVTIISGPSNVGVKGVLLGRDYYGWSNVIPGDYKIEIKDPACGTSTILSGTVAPKAENMLQQSLSSVGNSVCSGGGDIISNYVYNGDYSNVVELLNNTNTVIQSNTTGNFTNLPAGTYKTRIKVTPWCDEDHPYYIDGSTVNLTAAGQAPVVSRRMGIICEDADGNPTSFGNIYVKTEGVAPITIQYRLVGNSNWTTVTTNATASETISNLALGNYEIRAIDGCGNSTANYPTALLPVGQIAASNTTQPCYNKPYELKVPNYDTPQVTYEWYNSSGVKLGTDYNYIIPNYTAANDGKYTALVKLGTCVTRKVEITLNGNNCGQPIGGACYRTAESGSPATTLHGITTLGRAGATQDNWPMVRNSAHTVLESKSKGFVINRMTTDASGQVPTSVIASPVKGMMIYDTTNDCLKIFDGTSWKCFTKPACPTN